MKWHKALIATLLALAALPGACLDYQVVASYPRSAEIFTQGLLLDERGDRRVLFESGGGYGQSTLRALAFPSGKMLRQAQIPAAIFAEGIATVGERLYLLSWRERQCLVFERDTLRPSARFSYRGEGWGLSADPRQSTLAMSDGSSWLSFRDPQDFRVIARRQVREEGRPVERLNELEWIEGHIFANILNRDRIVLIRPSDGRVVAALELAKLRELMPATLRRPGVLNGIAWDARERRLLVTGKNWPRMFALRLPALSRLPSAPFPPR